MKVEIQNLTARNLGYMSHQLGPIMSVWIVESDDVISLSNVRLNVVDSDYGGDGTELESKSPSDGDNERDGPKVTTVERV